MNMNDRQASQLLLSDLVGNILKYSDNPGECAKYISSQIRELVGVRSVAIFSGTTAGECAPVAFCPDRTKTLWDKTEATSFVASVFNHDVPQIIESDEERGGIAAPLNSGTSFVIPLMIGQAKVGIIILFDLLESSGAAIILDTLSRIAPILALILKNSFLYKNMEKMVEARTAELKNSEERFRRALDNAPFPIMIHSENGSVVMINSAWTELTGYTHAEIPTTAEWTLRAYGMRKSIVQKDIEDLYSLTGKKNEGEYQVMTSAGKMLIWDFSSASLGILPDGQRAVISMARDVTTSKIMESELQKAQKLESLGILAGGIAHDFNNLMGGIYGYINMASETTREGNVASYLSKAMNTIDRTRALTQQLLTFAKGGAPIQEVGNLFPFIEETAKFALSGANVICKVDAPKDVWVCNFDRNQIGQVIDNIIINAQQAMPMGGTIELTARNCTLAEREHPLLIKGNYVRISIKDTGVGIPKELITKIFDPFFTTKAKGHGLGLATCYSIIHRHGGCIDVESEQGIGTVFKVYLPATTASSALVKQCHDIPHRGSGTFLIMDDEEVMRDIIGDMLKSFGYTVVCKKNGKEAIDFISTEMGANRKVAGMVFDLTVPGGMGGKAAVEEIRKLNKDIPVFVASGYADDPVIKKPSEYGFTASICKPFRKTELSEILNRYIPAT